MATRKEVMHNLVKEEAKNLKKHADKKQLENLNFKFLDFDSPERCIYGQITGDCFSEEAHNLIQKCAKRVYKSNYNELNWESNISTCKLNGKPEIKKGLGRDRVELFYSPIEVFIAQDKNITNGNNEKLVNYLKGKITRLNFK